MIQEDDKLWPFYRATVEVQRAYQNVFGDSTVGSTTVLLDLAKLCFAHAPTTTEREQGMRDVWLHIQKRLRLRDEELAALLAKLTPEQRTAMFDRSPIVYSPR